MSHTARRTHPHERPDAPQPIATDRLAHFIEKDLRRDRDGSQPATGTASRGLMGRASGGLRDVPDDAPPPELVRLRVRRTALVPSTLTIACDEHAAEVGAYCYPHAHGVCW